MYAIVLYDKLRNKVFFIEILEKAALLYFGERLFNSRIRIKYFAIKKFNLFDKKFKY